MRHDLIPKYQNKFLSYFQNLKLPHFSCLAFWNFIIAIMWTVYNYKMERDMIKHGVFIVKAYYESNRLNEGTERRCVIFDCQVDNSVFNDEI